MKDVRNEIVTQELTKDNLRNFIQEYIKGFKAKEATRLDDKGIISRTTIAELERIEVAIFRHFDIEIPSP